MAIPAPRHHYSFADYLAVEAMSVVRHEFLNGAIYAMAGGSALHAALAMAAGARLLDALRGGPCRVFSSDLRVRVRPTGLATYPDVTVVCGDVSSDPDSRETVANPLVVVEVLSDSTADYDRTEKLQHYQEISSLQAVLLVDHRTTGVDLWQRDEAAWRSQHFGAGEVVPITAIRCSVSVDEIYAAARDA
jgi:Uma2 family endonuclease